ncbi:unnamed protein product [Mycena citricolor]|uniref:Uncharacterized protein n=1 Tax=Mycena citricolor TaxID=2018698 RepID=A0AAD2K096_9AGAR|nr:unnamed protein product [Mycena citricolor]
MHRPYNDGGDAFTRPNPGLSRNSTNVSWSTKIRGAVQIGQGLTDTLRGTLGASDFGPHRFSSSDEIAGRGRHQIAQGLARIRGVPTDLPPAPLNSGQQNSRPISQYDERPRSASLSGWYRRSFSGIPVGPQPQNPHRNPSTRSTPFDKFYEDPVGPQSAHRTPPEDAPDPGFAGLGAGVDPSSRRKDGSDRISPAFMTNRSASASTSSTNTVYPRPTFSAQTSATVSGYPRSPGAYLTVPVPESYFPPSAATAPRTPPPLPPRRRPTAPLPPDLASDSASVTEQGSCLPTFGRSRSTPPCPIDALPNRPPARRDVSGLEQGGYSVMTYDAKDALPSWPPSGSASQASSSSSARLHPQPHQHEARLEHAGYDVLPYDAKDSYPTWPSEREMRGSNTRTPGRAEPKLEPLRRVR